MNLVLLFDEDFRAADRVELTGRRFRHMVEVHRARVGDSLRVGRLNGRMGTGRVVRLDADSLEMEVVLERPPPAPLPLTLLLALPRPKVLRRVLQSVAAMGVKRLVLMRTWRVEKSYWESPLLAPEAMRAELLLGLEQGCDTVLPAIALEPRFRPFVEDRLPALAADALRLVADPRAGRECPRDVRRAVTLAIGPEGGFIPYEVEALERAGFAPVTLGERILRVEQAVPAFVGRLF